MYMQGKYMNYDLNGKKRHFYVTIEQDRFMQMISKIHGAN